jgi:hypothetical protein
MAATMMPIVELANAAMSTPTTITTSAAPMVMLSLFL